MIIRIHIWIVVLLSTFAFPQASVKALISDEATIAGCVSYSDGNPVEGAQVEINTFGPVGGILPSPVQTDKAGRYSITYPPLGDGYIAASKQAEGYPNTLLAIYNRRNTPNMKRIFLKAGMVQSNVDLMLKNPNPIVIFQLKNAPSGRPLDNSRIRVEWPEDSSYMLSEGIPKDGTFTLVLPDHAINVTISAPGHRNWRWKADYAAAKSAGKSFDRHTTTDVQLKELGPYTPKAE